MSSSQAVESPLHEWLVIIPDLEGSHEKRPHLGKQHVAEMQPDRGKFWLLGGMMLDEENLARDTKKVTWNVIVARAASKDEVLQALWKDVYATDGVWDMEKIRIMPFESLFRLGLGFD